MCPWRRPARAKLRRTRKSLRVAVENRRSGREMKRGVRSASGLPALIQCSFTTREDGREGREAMMREQPDALTTARLSLREPRAEDAARIAAFAGDFDVAR